MITSEITFHAPTTAAEALELLDQQGEDVTVLAGGMSLVPMMNLGIVQPDVVMSLNHVGDLGDITDDGERLTIGAMVRHRRVLTDPLVRNHCPPLAGAAGLVGDVQVRNRGSIGGSIAHADPAADYLPVLAALGGVVTLRSRDGSRTLSSDEFFIDVMFTTREPTELVTAVSVPKLGDGWGTGYQRLARVEGSFAIVNAAAVVAADRSAATVALGGVGPKPVVIDASEQVGDGLGETAMTAVGDAAYAAAEAASGDIMSDAEYRREMARVYAKRALRQAFDASGHGSRRS